MAGDALAVAGDVERIAGTEFRDLRVLERLAIPSTKPEVGSVMLGQVATLEMGSGPALIDRYDRARNINFEIELSGVPLGEVHLESMESRACAGLRTPRFHGHHGHAARPRRF